MKSFDHNKAWIPILGIAILLMFSLFIYKHFSPASLFTGKNKSIAVLPFINMNNDKESEYFSDGLTDEIIGQLVKIADLKVVARPTIMIYKNSKKDIREIASTLKVSAVLTGGVERTGNVLSIHTRLVDAGSGHTIWETTYQRELKDIFTIQSEVSRFIAEQLNLKLTETEKNKISERPTLNLEAYNFYLKGRYCYYQRDEKSLHKGIEYFNQAIQLDSVYSRAYSGLADCYSALGYASYEMPSTVFLKAEKAAIKAIALDSTLAEPYTSLGYIKFYYYWDWQGAEQEFIKAIQLNPNYVQAYVSYGYYLTSMERFPEARQVMEKAMQLDPLSAAINTDMGFFLYYAREYNQAIRFLKSALELNPKSPLAHNWYGRIFQVSKKYEEAIQEYQYMMEYSKGWSVAYAAIGNVYGISGRKDSARIILAKMKSDSSFRYVTPYGIGLVYASINEKDRAFECLNLAYAQHSNWLVWLKSDPRWINLHNDQRFQMLLEQIGLTKTNRPFNRE